MVPRKVVRDAFSLIGLQARTSNQQEADPATARIPQLWQTLVTEKLSQIPHHRELCALYTDYEKDHTGFYTIIVGALVPSLDVIPEGFVGKTVPQSTYLVFPAHGPVPESIGKAWSEIWSYFSQTDHKRAYTCDFELYTSPEQADVFIMLDGVQS